MNDIYIFDNDFNLQGIIDEYVSVIWRPSYYDVGDFELYLGATDKAIDLLRENRYIVRSSDILVKHYVGKNMLDIAIQTQTVNGVTFTVNDDKSVNVSGVATKEAYIILPNSIDLFVRGKQYVVSQFVRIIEFNSSGAVISDYTAKDGEYMFSLKANTDSIQIRLQGTYGGNCHNSTIYPMIRLSNITDSTYEPYVGGVPKEETTYKNVMIVKNLQLTTDIENGDFYCVTGRELKYLLHQRIIWNQTNLKGTAEDAIRRLVNENAINPTDVNRVIPNLMLGALAGLTATIEKQVRGKQLDEVITEICKTYNYGWNIYVVNKKLTLVVYAGVDRSYDQIERPYVIFSDNFENLYNTEYELFTESYANTTLIGGEGEGVDRIFTTVNNSNAGLDRYETFTDARDISQNKGTNEEITLTDYGRLLEQRGRDNLLTMTKVEGFTGEVLSDVAFKYGTDFFMGDLVTVINKYGIQKNVRVLSAIESEDETGKKLLPQFNL